MYTNSKRRPTLCQAAGHNRSSQKCVPHFDVETLEQRLVLDGALNTFAGFAGELNTPREVDTIPLQLDPMDFTLRQGRVLLGFAVRPTEGSGLDPANVRVMQRRSEGDTLIERADTAGDPASFTLVGVERGRITVQVRGEARSTGAYEMDVFLAGDANADFQVNRQDIDLIRGLRGTRRGVAGYMLDADVDRNGVIARRDVSLARMNLGVSTLVRSLEVTLGLDPTFDRDGDGVVNQAEINIRGQTNSGATVRLDQGDDGSFEQMAVADRGGVYRFDVRVEIGPAAFSVEAQDRFGQHAAASLSITRSSNTAVTTDAGVQQMPSVAVNPLDPNHVVIAYMDRSLVSTGYAGLGVAVSHDGGDTWQHSSIPLPVGFDQGAAHPIAKFDDRGHVFVTFMSVTFLGPQPALTHPDFFNPERNASDREFGFQANNGVFVSRSDDGGLTWNSPVAVDADRFEGIEVSFKVFPDLAVDTFAQLPDGRPNPNYANVYLVWTRLYPVGQFPGHPEIIGGGDVYVAVSRDGGMSWEIKLQEQGGILVTVIQDSENTVGLPGLTIVDSAQVAVGPEGDIYVAPGGGGDFAVHHSTDGGSSFTGADHVTGRRIAFGTGFKTFVNADGIPTNHFRTRIVNQIGADPTRPGTVYACEVILNLDPLGNEIDSADVFFARSSDYGETWQTSFEVGTNHAVVLNDDNDGEKATGGRADEVISGQALPRVAVDADGNVETIWYDTRRDPANHLVDVFGTVSSDGGQTFSPNVRVTDFSFDADAGRFMDAIGRENFYLGDFIGLAMANNSAYAAWTDTRPGNQDVFFTRFQVGPVPPALNDRFEPNDTPELTSSPTELGRVVRRVLPKLSIPAGDQDWFHFESAATGTLTVSAFQSQPGDNLRIELYDGTGITRLATGMNLLDAAGQVNGEQIVFPSSARETFQLRVLPIGPGESRYSLDFQSLTADLGTRVHALARGSLASGDEAFFLVRAGAPGSLDVELASDANVQGDLNLELLDADKLTLLASGRADGQPGPGEVEQASLPVEKLRAVLIHVVGTAGSQGDFALELTNFDQFTTPENATLLFPAGAGPSQAAIGDLNSDQIPDVAVSNALTDTLSVLLGNGDGTFQAPRQFGVGAFVPPPGDVSRRLPSFGRDVAISDFNRDDMPDVAVTNFASSDVSVLLGRGDGTFEPQRRFDATFGPVALEAGDLNADTIADLAVVSNSSSRQTFVVATLLGRGDGTFQPQRTIEVPSGGVFNGGTLRIAKLDMDDVPDLVVSGTNTQSVSILLGNGDGTFTFAGQFEAGRIGVGLVVTDLNGDGRSDIANTGFDDQNRVVVLLGKGDGTFQAPLSFFAGQNPVAVEVVDVASQLTLPDGSTTLGPPDGHLDAVVAVSGAAVAIQVVGPPEVVVLPGLVDELGAFIGFGSPNQLASAQAPQDIDVGDLNDDRAVDIVVVDRPGVQVIYGQPPNVVDNNTPQTARDLGTVVHLLLSTQTIVPGHEDAFFTLRVPTEVVTGAGDEVIDFSALFEHTEGAGIHMEVLDAAGNVLASGERLRVPAAQGAMLTLHVFGVTAADGSRGAGAYTLDIDVLPQVVSVESQPLLPGVGAAPGGPTASLVITFQGDRLDPTTAEEAANYRVTWLGPDGVAGTPDDQVIPITCGVAGSQCVVYDPSANVDVTTGKTVPTAVRQTVTLLFDRALPAGSYEIELSPAIQAAPFAEDELALLAGGVVFSGHPVVSLVGASVVEGSRQTAIDLVLAAGALGDLGVFKTGTPFLTQLHDDLGALLDAMLTERGDDRAITPALIDQILARFDPALGAPGARPTSVLVIWIDPGGISLIDPDGDQIVFDPDDDELDNDIDDASVDVTGNIDVIVVAGAAGEYDLDLFSLGATARGGVVVLDQDGNQTIELTDDIRDGTTSFTITV